VNEDVMVIVPTLNEELAIGSTIKDIQHYVPGCRVIVIDGHSDDNTVHIAEDAGAIPISAPRGKGTQVRTSLPWLLSSYSCKWVVMIDGYFTYPARHIPEVVFNLKQGSDVVLGYRNKREQGSMTTANRIGNWGLSMMASLLYGIWVRDVCTGLWGFDRDKLKEFTITSNRFTLEADLFVNAIKNKCRIDQIPTGYRARLCGSQSKLNIIDGLKIGWFLLENRLPNVGRNSRENGENGKNVV